MLTTGTPPANPLNLQLAGDGRGGAVAIWIANGHLESATFAFLSGWGPVETLADSVEYRPPAIAVSARGDSVVAWIERASPGLAVRRRAAGSRSWEAMAHLLGGSYIDQPPRLGIDDEGAAVLTWAESQSGIWIARYRPGMGWEQPGVLEALQYAAYHDAAVTATGLATVPYVFFRNPGRWQTCGVHFRASGVLATSVDCVEPPWRAFGSEILAASGADGRTLAVWAEPQIDGGWPGRSAAWWRADRGWSPRTLLDSGSNSALAVDGRGAGIVLVTAAEPASLRAHRFEEDRGWLPVEDLLTVGATSSSSASIALEATGSGWAVWDEKAEGGRRAVARGYVQGAGWSSAGTVTLTQDGVSLASDARVVVDGRGGALVVWTESPPGGGTASLVARQYVAEN